MLGSLCENSILNTYYLIRLANYMNFFKSLPHLKPLQVLKIAGIAIVAIIIITLAIQLVGNSVNSLTSGKALYTTESVFPSGLSYDEAYNGVEKSRVRGIAPEPPSGGAIGGDAEDYEVAEYRSTIETRHLEDTCNVISNLKTFDYVVFLNANEYDKGCGYTFKVEKERAGEILNVIKGLDPKELTENVYTIKKTIEDLESEEDVLKRRKKSIKETLGIAIDAYDDITSLATRTENADALASIIESRIRTIEQLTGKIIAINARLESLANIKVEQLDRLEYTYFYVTVYENVFVDFEDLKDSWKTAVKDFVRNVNNVLQDVTINLIALLIYLAQYVLYLLILLLVVKYGWRVGVYIWKK